MPNFIADITGTLNLKTWGPLPELHPTLSAIAPPSVSFCFDDGKVQTSVTLYNPGMAEDTAEFWTTDQDGICNTAEDTFGEEEGATPWEDLGQTEFAQIVAYGKEIHRRIESAVLDASQAAVKHGSDAYNAVLAFALDTPIEEEQLTGQERALNDAHTALEVYTNPDTRGMSAKSALRALLTDLRHKADDEGLDFNDLLDRSYGYYAEEKANDAFATEKI